MDYCFNPPHAITNNLMYTKQPLETNISKYLKNMISPVRIISHIFKDIEVF